jgi:hypothetical protein
MKPQTQRYLGGPGTPRGEYGDCHRTCVAMILNMHRDDVPHFMADCEPNLPPEDPRSQAAEVAELQWLAKRRITAVNIPFPGETPFEVLLEMTDKLTHSAPVILGCTAGPRRMNHSVVLKDGIVYNPNPTAQIAGPMRDGFWWLTIYSVGMRWRSPLLIDRLKGLLR